MIANLRFLHLLGMAVWFGSALAAMVLAVRAKSEEGGVRERVQPLIATLHSTLIAPSAIVTILSGLFLSMSLGSRGMGDVLSSPGVVVMQAAGLLAGVVALAVGLPTATRLAALAAMPPSTELNGMVKRLNRKQAVASSISGTLILAALFFGVVVR